MHGSQFTIPQGPTIGARGLLRPLELQPAAHVSQRGRYPTPESPTIIERENPGPSRQQPATQDTVPAPARLEPDQRPSIQAVDFSQNAIEPNNPFPPECVEAEINRRVDVRLAEERRKKKELRRQRKQSRHKRSADRHPNRPMPGAYPLRNLRSPAPTASLERPNSLPPRVATTTTHSLPQLQPSSIPADKLMTSARGLRLDPMVAFLGLQEPESILTRGTMSVHIGLK